MSNIQQVDISTVMKIKYMDYAISVIVGRALPDVRDGMKWVHRRIIYSMAELGLTPEKGYRKSARIVGDVLGKYHPHGDSSVYDAMVRMAQDFSVRHVLVDGHGNWGSVDGDSAAAYRYTEAKMKRITLELLKDINKNTVDFTPNFDGEEKEPTVLPCRFPNLLVNGSEGIAVGVATSIPPHNLIESINSVIYQLDNPNCTIEDLVKILKAPDFPTGAEIINPQDMVKIYSDGYGKIIMRAKYHIEEDGKQKKIIITEIPYQVNKSKLLENIFILSNDTTKTIINGNKKEEITIKAKIPDIDEIIDESDRTGMRINIKLKKNVNPNKVLSLLFKHSDLQSNYGANFTAIYGTNRLLEHLNLKQILEYYINHQKEVLTRRTQFDLEKSKKRLHILEGLRKAILDLDKTLELIKTSKSKSEARERLITHLLLDEEQVNAILSLQLQRLTGLEIETIQNEYNELLKTVTYLNSILNNEEELLNVLKNELIEIRDKYGDERRTQLVYEDNIQDISKEDLIEDHTVTLCLSKEGYIKRNLKFSESQRLKENDEILQLHQTTNKTDLLLFTSLGRMYIRKTYDIEEKTPSQIGEYLPNIIDLLPDEKVIYIGTTKDWNENLICVFENGQISKMNLQKTKPQQNRKVAIENIFNTTSPLKSIIATKKDIDILLLTQSGHCLIVNSDQINAVKSKNGLGVVGISLDIENMPDDKVVGAMTNVSKDTSFTFKTERGKEIYILLDDVCPTNNDKNNLTYFSGRRGRLGNMIYNCRQKNDKIIELLK